MIHPTAIVSTKAHIGDNVVIGPYTIVRDNVVLHDHVYLHGHVIVEGQTTIGRKTEVYPYACIGTPSQNTNIYDGASQVIIGANNIIREYVSIQPGTDETNGHMTTEIGHNNLLMTRVTISHDCVVKNHCTLANNVSLAGHVMVDDYVTLGGSVGVHQWARIGSYAMVGALSGIARNVLPYSLVYGSREASFRGANIIGLKRHGFSNEDIKKIAYVLEYLTNDEEKQENKIKKISEDFKGEKSIELLLSFVQDTTVRGINK